MLNAFCIYNYHFNVIYYLFHTLTQLRTVKLNVRLLITCIWNFTNHILLLTFAFCTVWMHLAWKFAWNGLLISCAISMFYTSHHMQGSNGLSNLHRQYNGCKSEMQSGWFINIYHVCLLLASLYLFQIAILAQVTILLFQLRHHRVIKLEQSSSMFLTFPALFWLTCEVGIGVPRTASIAWIMSTVSPLSWLMNLTA